MINWDNVLVHKCVICGRQDEHIINAFYFCLRCGNPCEATLTELTTGGLFNALSVCCGADVRIYDRKTCSDACHATLIAELEKEFGVYKKVVDAASGIEYRVPLKDITEKGLTYDALHKYPRWEEPGIA